MIKALFGDVKTGRLMRLQYLGYSVLLLVPGNAPAKGTVD